MSDALLAQVVASPNDDSARCVYADWLLERGDERGKYLVTELELHAASAADKPAWRRELRKLRARIGVENLAMLEQPGVLRENPTPYEARWWSIDLPGARPVEGTYGSWPYASLPPLTAGLAAMGPGGTACGAFDGVEGPESFRRYFTTGPWKALRSCTDCFYNFGAPAEGPGGEGKLLRFYSDSQSCIHWYLFLSDEGDHCVVAGYEEFDDEQPYVDEPPEEDEAEVDEATQERLAADLLLAIAGGGGSDEALEAPPSFPSGRITSAWFVAPSFEQFITRFWLENEIWYARSLDKRPLTPIEEAYVAHYRRG